MNWFLVLLFWNPQIQEYGPLTGWDPHPYDTQALCDKTLQYIDRYLLDSAENVSDCIQAQDAHAAIEILKR